MKAELRVLLVEENEEEAALIKLELNRHRKTIFYHKVDTIIPLDV